MKKLILLVVAVIVLIALWYFVSPLFIDKEVNEGFPTTTGNGSSFVMPTEEEFEAMSDEEKHEKEMAMIEEFADKDKEVVDPMPDTIPERDPIMQSGPTALASGNFRDGDSFHKGSGSATIYQINKIDTTLRLEDFSVTNGPDLRVYLVDDANPTSSGQITDGDYIELTKLKGNKGNQNYEIPAGTDTSLYKSVVIYCKPFRVIFATATLR